jgi:CRP-like cAMP-binding protein
MRNNVNVLIGGTSFIAVAKRTIDAELETFIMQESPYLDDKGLLLERLQQLPLLGAVSETHIRKILRLSRIRKFDDGELITRENDYDLWVYLLFSGAVRVSIKDKEIRRISEVGAVFGEVAALNGKARSATVHAMGSTVCLAIDVAFIQESTEPIEHATFVALLYKLFADVMAQRLRVKDEELEALNRHLVAMEKDRDALRKSEAAVRRKLEALQSAVGNRWIMK